MKNLSKTLFILFLFSGTMFVSCQPNNEQQATGPDLDQLKAELQEMENAYAYSENNKNTDGMASYYADDAQSLPDNEATILGKAAILERIQNELNSDSTQSEIRFEVVDVFADGDLVVEVGRSITTNEDGSETTGKYMSLFERRDGKLVCIRDIWNDDAPSDDEDDDDDHDNDDSDDDDS